jgi:hypothetical protein
MDLYIHSPIRLNGLVLNYLSTGTTLLFIGENRLKRKKETKKERKKTNRMKVKNDRQKRIIIDVHLKNYKGKLLLLCIAICSVNNL